MQIKVCGITRIEDIELCCKLGINALGFILAKSPRQIKLDDVAKITKTISPFISKVAVVVNPDSKFVERIIESKLFDFIQFHGDEDPKMIAELHIKTIKAISINIKNQQGLEKIEIYKNVDYFLFDSKTSSNKGGTGISFDWNLLKTVNINKPYILAGGLGPDNIEKALSNSNLAGIDLNSKVEKSPGIKNHKLLRETIRKIRKYQLESYNLE